MSQYVCDEGEGWAGGRKRQRERETAGEGQTDRDSGDDVRAAGSGLCSIINGGKLSDRPQKRLINIGYTSRAAHCPHCLQVSASALT